MDTLIPADRLDEERAFIKRYTEGLASQKVGYPADYSTPLEDRPRKVPVVGIPIAEPPDVMDVDQSPSQDTSITLTVKCLKPSLSITVTAQTTDTVADLKTLVSKSSSSAPAAATQRLLLKGKALTGTKLLKEYDIQDGATIHLLLKAVTNTTEASAVSASSSSSPGAAPPSLTITTSLDDSKPNKAVPMTEADIDVPPKGPQPQISSAAFHSTVSEPRFWQRIHTLCVSEFAYEDDADAVWESFLGSMKGKLSAGEAAKIRDVVGVRGMGGGA